MKKKFLGVIAIAVIALAVALNVNVKSNDYGLSDLALDNVEALGNQKPHCYDEYPHECCCNENKSGVGCPCVHVERAF